MRKLLIFGVIIVILYSGVGELQQIWNSVSTDENGETISIGDRVDRALDKIGDGIDGLTSKGKEIREDLNEKIDTASEKYKELESKYSSLKEDIEEKTRQLQEAKEALDALFGEKEKEAAETTTEEEVTGEVEGTATQ